jgi:hypothetical protein
MERRAGYLRPGEVITSRSDAIVYLASQTLLAGVVVVAIIAISSGLSWGLVPILALGVPAQILRTVMIRRVMCRHGDRVPAGIWRRNRWLQRQLDRLAVMRGAIALLGGRHDTR